MDKNEYLDKWINIFLSLNGINIPHKILKTAILDFEKSYNSDSENHPIQAINNHLNAITDLLATTKELDKDFITAILRHIKGFKATLRKEVLR